jgi:hypothetical protein
MQVTTLGLDIAKNVFQVHGIDVAEKVVVRAPVGRPVVADVHLVIAAMLASIGLMAYFAYGPLAP